MSRLPGHGGARKGAGRPALHARRVRLTADVEPALAAWIDANLDAPDVLALSRTHLISGVLGAYRDEVEARRKRRS